MQFFQNGTESNNIDCGIDGEDNAPVTHRAHNRFIARVLVGHIKPMHSKLQELDKWNKDAEKLLTKAEGALIAVKWLGGVLLLAVSGTFATTMYIAVEVYRAIPK